MPVGLNRPDWPQHDRMQDLLSDRGDSLRHAENMGPTVLGPMKDSGTL